MTAFTPNFGLPYPTASDEPCDFAEQWCAFTDAMQAVLDGFQSSADRSFPLIPIAQMRLTTPVTLTISPQGNFAPVPFDTVEVDTADWVDFDTSQSSMTINRAGRFMIVGNAALDPVNADNTIFLIRAVSGAVDQRLDFGGDIDIGGVSAAVAVLTSPQTFELEVAESGSSNDSLTIFQATLTAYWIADGATP